jgi:cytochrome c
MKRLFYWTTSAAALGACMMLSGGQQANAKAAGDAAKGKEVFEQCAVCHSADTDEKKIGPSLKGLFKHEKMNNGKKVDEASVRQQINEGGNGMPAYADMLSQEEKDNVIAYLKTL